LGCLFAYTSIENILYSYAPFVLVCLVRHPTWSYFFVKLLFDYGGTIVNKRRKLAFNILFPAGSWFYSHLINMFGYLYHKIIATHITSTVCICHSCIPLLTNNTERSSHAGSLLWISYKYIHIFSSETTNFYFLISWIQLFFPPS